MATKTCPDLQAAYNTIQVPREILKGIFFLIFAQFLTVRVISHGPISLKIVVVEDLLVTL